MNLKYLRPLGLSVVGVFAAFAYFSWKVSSRSYTQTDYENDRRIQQALGLDCGTFQGSDLVGKNVGDVDRFSRLRNSILAKGQHGHIETTNDDETRSEQIETQAYIVCGKRFVTLVYGGLIVEAVSLPQAQKGRLFGIDG